MQLHASLESLHLVNAWLTIGSFDGVHIGHQSVIRAMVAGAHAAGASAVAITFHPHPAIFFKKVNTPFYLTSPEERAILLGSLGVDHVITLPFDQSLANLTAEEFSKQLVSYLGLQQLWIGFNFKLGRNREGTPERLAEIGQQLGFQVVTMSPFQKDCQNISSSLVRQTLLQGDVTQTAQFLGRPYRLTGVIVQGDKRGRELGVPTANLNIWSERILPKPGVYATFATVENRSLFSVTNIGFRPTFGESNPLQVETHILDFNEMIYQKELTLDFIQLLRNERRFASKEDLIHQLNGDIENARKVLSNAQSATGLPA